MELGGYLGLILRDEGTSDNRPFLITAACGHNAFMASGVGRHGIRYLCTLSKPLASLPSGISVSAPARTQPGLPYTIHTALCTLAVSKTLETLGSLY